MLELESATRTLADILVGVGDDQLAAPTPCTEACLGDLIDHVDGLAMAFAAAAAKELPEGGSQAPSADGSRLGTDWRNRIPQRLARLAEAWRDDAAWTGMTQVGGGDFPGSTAGMFGLNEILVHGWDIAVASGQRVAYDPELVAAAYEFVGESVAQNPDGTPGLFGPPVAVPPGAPMFERLIALTGRDPSWAPARS